MSGTHEPVKKIRAKAAGIAYTGIATNWRFSFGDVIIIAASHEAVATVSLALEERKEWKTIDPGLCKEVAIFQMSDVEVA